MGSEASGGGDASNATAGVPQPGDIVGGKFVVERVLGIGGMGIVVAAHHAHLEQTVAIKFLRRDAAKDEAAVARFLREARAVAFLQSEHVVRVMDAGRLEDGLPYLVMEYLDGADLDQVLAHRTRLPLEETVEYLLQAMEAVAEAHAAGIVHRDLKPSNLFVTTRSDGTPLVKVLDFGISKALDTSGRQQVSLTATSMTLGSPLYMSPEQVRSSKTVDARTDIWALGIIAYELLAGVQPFEAETVTGLCAKIVADEPVPLRSICPEVPPAFEEVVLRCLAKNPASRYRTVGELAAALRPFASPEGRASVTRIGRIGGLKPTLASAIDTPVPTPPTPAPPTAAPLTPRPSEVFDPAAGYAETVQSWQEAPADPRGKQRKQVKTATAATLGGLAVAACLLVVAKWPHGAPQPANSAAPSPPVSAASLVDVRAATTKPEASFAGLAPLPGVAAETTAVAPPPSGTPAERLSPEAAPSAAASALHSPGPSSASPPRRPLGTKPAGAAPAGRTTEDLLLDRK